MMNQNSELKLEVAFGSYTERPYTSKKTGNSTVIKEANFMSSDGQILAFGYGTLPTDVDTAMLKSASPGDAVTLALEIYGDQYNKFRPTVKIKQIILD